mgnify:CR=1 FL=1
MGILDDLILKDIHTIIFDFDGVFTDNKVYLDKDGNEFVMCDRADGLAFDLIKKFITSKGLNIDYFILSTETNPVVLSRAKKLNIKCFHGIKDKLKFVKDFFHDKYRSEDEIKNGLIYLGNDLNDLKIMDFCKYTVAPSDAHQQIIQKSKYCLSSRGGNGFIREFVEKLIFSAKIDILTLL